MREIVPPPGDCGRDVDSLGKLREWLDVCGMPQQWPDGQRAPDPVEALLECGMSNEAAMRVLMARPRIDTKNEEWGFGFAFDPADREAANLGYRELVAHFARTCYARFSQADAEKVAWRYPPTFIEFPETETTLADGSAITDWDAVEDNEVETISNPTGRMIGAIRARLVFVKKALT